jgi:hypothetical protein
MFIAPALLAGLLAIGLPIWLHRVSRANPQRVPFASHMLLESSELQQTAKRTIRYWLLLALRIALLVALAFAFAGPLLSPRIAPSVTSSTRLHAIVVDTSLSMQQGERWQRALREVDSVVSKAASGDVLMLVSASGRRIKVLHDRLTVRDAGLLRASLAELKPGIERLDYGLMMRTASNWLGTPRPATQLHVITDLQQSGSPLRFADLEPPINSKLELHDVGGEIDNTFVASAELAARDTRTLSVRVRTSSTQLQKREVVLVIDGKRIGTKPVSVQAATPVAVPQGEGSPAPLTSAGAPGTLNPLNTVAGNQPRDSEVVQFAGLELTPGTHRFEIGLQPTDSIAIDDQFYAVIEQTNPRVLLLTREAAGDDAAYFAAAIESLTAPRLRVERRAAGLLETQSLSGYALVVVSDVGILSSADATRLRNFVAGGGSLLVTLGAAADNQPQLIDGLRIGQVSNQPTQVATVQTAHPVLRDAQDWHRVRFLKHLTLQPAEGDQVLVRLADGAPLLIERTVSAGRMLVLAAPLDRQWNDLAIHPLFVRFVSEAARYLTGDDASAASVRVGSLVATGLTASGGGQIFDPQARRVLDLNTTSSSERFEPRQAGFYEIRGENGARWLAVNVDRRESDLSRIAPAAVERWRALAAAAPGVPDAAAQQKSEAAAPRESIGYLLLVLAALLVGVELLMANQYLRVHREMRTTA